MLRARVITALILLPLVLGAIYLLPLAGFALVFWLIVGVAAHEWAGLAGWTGTGARLGYVGVLALLSVAAWVYPETRVGLLLAGAVFWISATGIVLAYPRSAGWLGRPVLVLAGWLALLAAWSALIVIRERPAGAHWLVWLMVLVWAADIGAYFAGRRFGRHKLAPAVSPGKTWEGVLGGVVLAGAISGGALLATGRWAPAWGGVIAFLVVVSIFGDLFESVLKRHCGVKDSGTLLPGHGGALDRVDSLLAVLPFFALLLAWQSGLLPV